ncbi:hypothetical protein IDAT_01570 [Pseudidiomarina atlantica]|uniref:ABC transmembrane type-1 domain-containing protein n=1 Tax=Pseudidiomarina atlantica TaxID=1517416 RepID=A0A094IVH6_9GAMM|nr:hypothetical protein [Pseudidiomarina atlantica]KFZ29809.1 hypothetical protein IDAT_01570 [Pseudidiomarina atlantica]
MNRAWHWLVAVALLLLVLPWLMAVPGMPLSLPLIDAGVWQYPGIFQALLQSLSVGVFATLISTLLASCLIASFANRDLTQQRPTPIDASIGATFAAPHLAFAIAFLWLLTPFGWLDRLLPFSFSWFEQQSWFTLSMILILKETPFLLVFGVLQLRQLPQRNWLLQAQSLAESPWRAWWLFVYPAWLRAMRPALYVVAIYSVAVVDLALVAGPMNPPLLAPLVLQWQLDFTEAAQLLAAQGFWLLLTLGLLGLVWVRIQEGIACKWLRQRLRRLGRETAKKRQQLMVKGVTLLTRQLFVWLTLLSLLTLLTLSVSHSWFYPALWPQRVSLEAWSINGEALLDALVLTVALGALTALLATAMVVLLCEWQRSRNQRFADSWFLAGLFVPQLVLVLAWLSWSNQLSETWLGVAVLWAHVWFAFAYGYLVYAPSERNVSQQHLISGQSLGYGYWRSWWRFKRPGLQSAISYCVLITFLVSVAQYVPTLLLSSGLWQTLTTELVVLSSGAERMAPAVWASVIWLLASIAIVLSTKVKVVEKWR